MNPITIHLQCNNIEEVFLGSRSAFRPARLITEEAERYLLEEAELHPFKSPVTINCIVPPAETGRAAEFVDAIHKHFGFKKERARQKLHRILKLGWTSLLIALIFLAFLFSLTLFVFNRMPNGSYLTIFKEVVIIIGWVALWRPLDLLLYEWRQYKREARMAERFEKANVIIS